MSAYSESLMRVIFGFLTAKEAHNQMDREQKEKALADAASGAVLPS